MGKWSLLKVLTLIFLVSLSGCEFSCQVSTAGLSDPKMALAIDQDTQAPAKAADVFPPNAGTIYVTAKLSNAPSGTLIKSVWYYLEGKEQLIAQAELKGSGSRYLSFRLRLPAGRLFPSGKYEVRLFLNGKEKYKVPFQVRQP